MTFTHEVMHSTLGKIFFVTSKPHVPTVKQFSAYFVYHRFLGNLDYLQTLGRFEEQLQDFQGSGCRPLGFRMACLPLNCCENINLSGNMVANVWYWRSWSVLWSLCYGNPSSRLFFITALSTNRGTCMCHRWEDTRVFFDFYFLGTCLLFLM